MGVSGLSLLIESIDSMIHVQFSLPYQTVDGATSAWVNAGYSYNYSRKKEEKKVPLRDSTPDSLFTSPGSLYTFRLHGRF